MSYFTFSSHNIPPNTEGESTSGKQKLSTGDDSCLSLRSHGDEEALTRAIDADLETEEIPFRSPERVDCPPVLLFEAKDTS